MTLRVEIYREKGPDSSQATRWSYRKKPEAKSTGGKVTSELSGQGAFSPPGRHPPHTGAHPV